VIPPQPTLADRWCQRWANQMNAYPRARFEFLQIGCVESGDRYVARSVVGDTVTGKEVCFVLVIDAKTRRLTRAVMEKC
jgi:hypothetical protein